jgi:hypothetical protein
MSKNLLIQGFHFEKRAGRTVRGGKTEWEKAILDMLAENHPYVLESNPEFEIEWDEQDPENGMGRGKIVVWNREPLPAATPMESASMNRQGVEDPGKSATIPVFVHDFEIQDLESFITEDGAANRLSDKRWSEVMGSVGEMGAIDPNTDPQAIRQQTPTYNLPGSAAGWDRSGSQGFGTMEKVSGDDQFPLLKQALQELDPYDLERMKEAMSDQSLVAGFGHGRMIPVVRVMLNTSPRSLVDVENAAYDQLPPSMVFVQEIDKGPLSSRAAKFRATIVSDRYFQPSIVEGDFSMMVDALSSLVPDIATRLRQPGSFCVEMPGRDTVKPIVLEDLSMGFGQVNTAGNWLCAGVDGSMYQMDAFMTVCGFDGEDTGQKLLFGNKRWAMANLIAGRKLGDASQHVHESSATRQSQVVRGEWVAIVIDDTAYEPMQVVHCGPFRSNSLPSQLEAVTMSGEELAMKFGPIQKVAPADGIKWPDVQLSHGCAKYLIPDHAKLVILGGVASLEDNPQTMERTVATYARSGGTMVESAGRVRFVAGTDSEEAAHIMLGVYGPDSWSLRGQMLKGVTGQDVSKDITTEETCFLLCALGCSKEQAEDVMRRCQRDSAKTIHIAGLRPVCRTINADGTRKVPFFQKAAALAVHLRDIVTDEDRDVLFKAAAAIPFLELKEKVATLLEDGEVVDRLRFFGSVVPRFVELDAVEKLAGNFADPESLDVMLGINTLNERNVRSFLAKIAEMRAVEDNLAELSMMAKLGLSGVEVSDVSEALDSLGRVNEALEHVQSQMTQDKLKIGA